MKVGWYPDPDDENARRYWDGEEWSEPLPKTSMSTTKAQTPAAPPVPVPEPSTLYDPSQPVTPDNAPDDCVWAHAPYPGELPKRPRFTTVQQRMVAIGTVKGRPLAELEYFVGSPTSWSIAADVKHGMWENFTAYGGYSYTLSFDPYDVCFGIVHEYVT